MKPHLCGSKDILTSGQSHWSIVSRTCYVLGPPLGAGTSGEQIKVCTEGQHSLWKPEAEAVKTATQGKEEQGEGGIVI